MAILQKSSAVSRSSKISIDDHANALIGNLSSAFNTSAEEDNDTNISDNCSKSKRKNYFKSPLRRKTSNAGSIIFIPAYHMCSTVEPKHYHTACGQYISPVHAHTPSYTRPSGPDIVAPHLPSSCSSLPQGWTAAHDRFIAYLATHTPLTGDGEVPREEELRERWKMEDIARLLGERFPGLGRVRIRLSTIENRLILLDEAGDNDYFKIPYGGYMLEEWGKGI